MEKRISAPIEKEAARSLRAGDFVYIDGTIYTARDAAHKRMIEALEKGETLSCPGRASDWLRRPYNGQPYG